MSAPTRAWGALFVILAGCGGGVIQRADALPPAPPGTGFLEVKVTPPDADIYLGDAYMGRVDGYVQGVLRVPVGAHRVTLKKDGFYSHHQLVTVGADGARIGVDLVPEIATGGHRSGTVGGRSDAEMD